MSTIFFKRFSTNNLFKAIIFNSYQRKISINVLKDAKPLVTRHEIDYFTAIFPQILNDLTKQPSKISVVDNHFAECLSYVVPYGKKSRGLTTVAAFKLLENPENLNEINIKAANILGWTLEMAFFLVADDIIDHSQTRRGLPCWHKKEEVGLNAINDAFLLEQGIYTLLKKYFSGHRSYVPILELFHDMVAKTAKGQILDFMSNQRGKPNVNLFTEERYNLIVEYKTSYYSFYFPVVLAMHLANVFNERKEEQVKKILMKIGNFFQIQDDFLDCFGNPEITGKVGTDIKEGKCTWLAVKALRNANSKQRRVMEEFYGSDVDVIKALYEEMYLPEKFADYEEKIVKDIVESIDKLSDDLPRDLFLKMLNQIYRRKN